MAAVVSLTVGLGAVIAAALAIAAGDQEIAQALRAGGLVIVVRHGATFPDQADTDPLNFDNTAAQRNLNDKGKLLAQQFGDALRQASVRVGKVYTSKYNRAYETAVLSGFKDIEKTADLTEGVSSYPQTRIIAGPRPFEKCSPPRPKRGPILSSSRTIQTFLRRSAKTGST